MKTQKGVKVDAVEPTGWAAAKASAAMQDFLVKYPSLGFVYTLSDTLALPAANIAQRQNKLCTQQSNWTKNASCVGFVSVDGIFANRGQGREVLRDRAVLAAVVGLPVREAGR